MMQMYGMPGLIPPPPPAKRRGRPALKTKFLAQQGDLFADAKYLAQLSQKFPYLQTVRNSLFAGTPAARQGEDVPPKSEFFEQRSEVEKIDLLRSSTADQSGLPDFQD